MDTELSPAVPPQQGHGELYRIKIAIERTADFDPEPCLDLAQIWVLQDRIMRYPLTKASSRRWEMTGFVVLSDAVKAAYCVVKSGNGEDISSLNLEHDVMYSENSALDRTHWKEETCGTGVHLTIHGKLTLLPRCISWLETEDTEAINATSTAFRAFLLAQETPSMNSCTEVIDKLRRAVELCRWCHEALFTLLRGLVCSLFTRSDVTGSLPDIDEAISLQVTVTYLIPKDHEERPEMLTDLGQCFWTRFVCTGATQDIADTIVAAQAAVQAAPRCRNALRLLSAYLVHSFTRTGHLADLDDAISICQRNLGLTVDDHPCLATEAIFIAELMSLRFGSTGLLVHIDEAASQIQAVIDVTGEGNASLPDLLCTMGSVLMRRFKRTGCLSDRDESIRAHRRAVELTGPGHPSSPSSLHKLALSLHCSSTHTGNLPELEEGILLLHRLIEQTPKGHESLPGYLCDLESMLESRFLSTNDAPNTSEQVSVLRGAVEACQGGDTTILCNCLSDLASSLASLWRSTGDLMHLQEAIMTGRKILTLTSDGHLLLPSYLHTLASHLRMHWQATGQLSDLDESISIFERVVELCPRGDSEISHCHTELGHSLEMRYEVTHNTEDITKAISNLERSIQLIPPGHASLPEHYLHLATSRHERFKETASLVRNASQRGANLSVPAHVLAQYEEDVKGWTTALKLAATFPVGDPKYRMWGALKWAYFTMLWFPESPDILVALDTALGLLSLTVGFGQTIRTRHIHLQSQAAVIGTTTTAAFMACWLNRPDKALEWLEQGRCLVWNQINYLRTPLDNLRIHSPRLAETLTDVSKRLEIAGSSLFREPSDMDMPLRQRIVLQEEATAHLGLAQQWEELLHQVRAIPGFESFLQPEKCSSLLKNLPEFGVIIVVNVHEVQCDAIALLDGLDDPLHIPLPNFSEEKAKQHRRVLGQQLRSRELRLRKEDLGGDEEHSVRAVGGYRQPRGTPIRMVLRGLWVDVVRPILDMLAISKFERRCGEEPPRIWWCPTGVLSFLPLHAAGIYGPGIESENVFDYVVSSYTPTVSSLTEPVRKDHQIKESVSGLFLTSQPNAPGVSKIPGTTTEVRSIYKRAVESGIRALKVEGGDLTVNDCLDHLEEFSSVHLACHGYQNPEESLQSKFRFHSGTLDLATILRTDLKNADLAFLSACETSTGDAKLSDEAVHLAAGMLAAGYRRVVATMWCIGDKTAQEVSTSFYDWLFDHREPDSGSGFDGTLSAYALHHAIEKLRDDLGDTDDAILAWAPFVHWGY